MNFLNSILLLWANIFTFTLYLNASVNHLIPADELTAIQEKFSKLENLASLQIKQNSMDVSHYSTRGDARLFLGKFSDARDDYEKMVQINPTLNVSHWRLGIAYFYLSDFSKAARQFEIYHQYDNVDRENGIWRFMSQYKVLGLQKARDSLLLYSKDDRHPYPWLYAMYAGDILPEQVFKKIKEQSFSKRYETRVLFHANFYVGIFLELIEESPMNALHYLEQAVSNEYGRATGTYMWQVARLHHQQLLLSIKNKKDSQ